MYASNSYRIDFYPKTPPNSKSWQITLQVGYHILGESSRQHWKWKVLVHRAAHCYDHGVVLRLGSYRLIPIRQQLNTVPTRPTVLDLKSVQAVAAQQKHCMRNRIDF